MLKAAIVVRSDAAEGLCLYLSGDWLLESEIPSLTVIEQHLTSNPKGILSLQPGESFQWDSRLLAFLMSVQKLCSRDQWRLDIKSLPKEVNELFDLANAVPPGTTGQEEKNCFQTLLLNTCRKVPEDVFEHLVFAGEITLAFFSRLFCKSKIRWADTIKFCYQAGPAAIPIVTLQSVLVGMILAYLGIIQLRQFGAEVYISNLVALGMVREMGALMTGIIMAGRTGAAYAAQLGTMQVNEEVDALVTLGIKPVEYLVLPRMTALLVTMPLLCLYSNVLGMLGGGLIATSMDITWRMYLYQLSTSISYTDVMSGLFKSVVFADLIAVAGCYAGLNCGRSSAAVGQATTTAVVTAIIYLVVADAALNLLFFQLGV